MTDIAIAIGPAITMETRLVNHSAGILKKKFKH